MPDHKVLSTPMNIVEAEF